ncbi:MAG: hypothetical protein WC593_13940 [Methanoregula sp.]
MDAGVASIHREWIQSHIIADMKSKDLLSIAITNEQVSDGEVFPVLLEQAQIAFGDPPSPQVLPNGAYD